MFASGNVGLIIAIIGAITGINGSVMGYVNYRKTKGMKALDLRLELLKAEADVRADSSELPMLLEKADRKRKAVAALEGWSESGAMSSWAAEVAADKLKVKNLRSKVPDIQSDYRKLRPEELEQRIVMIHRLQTECDQIREKYSSELAKDERKRT